MSTGAADRVLVVIPARLASTRLPRKVLAQVDGKPLVQHVAERAIGIDGVSAVIVATDSAEVLDAVNAFGGTAALTSADHTSGTDRVAEVARDRDEEIVLNLQGDEPEFEVRDVEALISAMRADPSLPMGTLAAPAGGDEIGRPSVVKVVCGLDGRALYFSRAPIPLDRDARDVGARAGAARDVGAPGRAELAPVLRHVGIYAFRRDALLRFASLPPTPLERTERLEQLRALENGWAIGVVQGHRAPPGIDTPEDLEAFRMRVALATREEESDS